MLLAVGIDFQDNELHMYYLTSYDLEHIAKFSQVLLLFFLFSLHTYYLE